jgi:plastocyanin
MKLALAFIAAALALPATAAGATFTVSAQFQAFGPTPLDVLPGESVQWENVSDRNHTVTADDGSFDTPLGPGDTFTHEFDTPGEFAYHCTIHAGMVGEVDVRPVILGPLPTAAVPAGNQVEFDGRSADTTRPVRIQRSTGGSFQTIATATPAPDGSWKASIAAQATGDYRAEVDAGVSEIRHLIVSDRKVLVRATRRGVAVTVTPALPYARVLLEQNLRERFGWWPSQSTRLDYVSQASFRVARPARIRVLLVAKDGWTALATSAELKLGHVGRSRPKPKAKPMPMPMPH